MTGIKSPSSASNSSDFILIRILNKDYKILFSRSKNRVEKFNEAIKVSYFHSIDDNDKRGSCEKTTNSNSEKNIKNINSNANSDIELNTNKNNDNNDVKLAIKKPILKSKTKPFARIPVQSQEFENVRLYKCS